jgi:hypothetical protein
MKRIIYLLEQPFDQRNYERFGIATWLRKGWIVEAWDLTPFVRPQVWKSFRRSGGQIREFAGYHRIGSRREFDTRFATMGAGGYFVDYAGSDFRSMLIKKRLVESGIAPIVSLGGSVPEPAPSARARFYSRLKRVVTQSPIVSLERVAGMIVRRVVADAVEPAVVVVAGEESLNAAKAFPGARIIKAHNFDYDIYLSLRNSPEQQGSGSVVFVDQDYCFHRDFLYVDIPTPVTPNKYFPVIRRSLKKIGEAFGASVEVAAHPRSSYHLPGREYFEDIPVQLGKTAQLIRGAKVVVGHYSTSLQLAVLFNKPIVFLTTDQVEASEWSAVIPTFAAALGKKPVNVDRDPELVDWREAARVDAGSYAAYRRKYIKLDGSPERPYWEIVAHALDGLEARTNAA